MIVSRSANVGVTVGNCTVRSTATTAASTPAMSTATALTRFARTPTSRAVWKSIAAARMCRPIEVRFRSSTRSARQTAAVTIATIAILRMSTPPTETGRLSSASDAAVFPSGPNQRSAMLWSRNATANVAISITAGDCERSGRKTTRSIASDSAITTAKQSAMPTPTGQSRSDAKASANAPAMISCPYAKLTSRSTPKTRPMPTAISAKIAPSPIASTCTCRSTASRRKSLRPLARRSREVGGDHPVGVGRVGGGQGQAQLAVREHVRPVGERDRALRALLDEEDREPAVADRAERREHEIDDRRRQAERGLVEEQDARPRDERARDRELLLLPARERAGVPCRNSSQDREELVRRRSRSPSTPSRSRLRRQPELQVLLDGQLAEEAAALRNERDPAPGDRPPGCARAATARRDRTSPPARGTRPMIACSVVDLPAPFGPMSPTISPGATLE